MTLVVDASAVLDLLVRSDRGDKVRAYLTKRADEGMATVAHLDAEVFSGLARLYRADDLNADEVAVLVRRLGDRRSPGCRSQPGCWTPRGLCVTTSPHGMRCTSRPHRRYRPTWSPPTTVSPGPRGDVAVDLDGDQS